MTLIAFHELGHFLAGKFFNWNVDKIYIYPLGGVTKFNDDINKPLKEELIVTLMGPIFQIILAYFLSKFDDNIRSFNIILLHFNLLPIVPLDGSKLLLILLSVFKPFKRALNLCIKISFMAIFITLLLLVHDKVSFLFMVVVILLCLKIKEERSNENYIYNKFLLERYIKGNHYKKNKIVYCIFNMYKYKKNIINKNNKLYTEREALEEYYLML